MCDAEVYCRPRAMKKNSTANNPPASRPPIQVIPSQPCQSRCQSISKPTSKAAIPERNATCIKGAISGAASLIATCCTPQIAHNNSIT